MKIIKYGLLFGFLLVCVPVCGAITIKDVQALDRQGFFGGWSKFLDQVLDARPAPLSPVNEALYQAFIDRARVLDLPSATGDKDSIEGLKKQMDLIKKRISDEKIFFDEWSQFGDAVTKEKTYPVVADNEKLFEEFVERGKVLNIKKSALEELPKQMDAIREKLRKESEEKKAPKVKEVVVEAAQVPSEAPSTEEIVAEETDKK